MKKRTIIIITSAAALVIVGVVVAGFFLRGTLTIAINIDDTKITVGEQVYDGGKENSFERPIGPHKISVSKDFYTTETRWAWILPGKTRNISINLALNELGLGLTQKTEGLVDSWDKFTKTKDKQNFLSELSELLTADCFESQVISVSQSGILKPNGVYYSAPEVEGPIRKLTLEAIDDKNSLVRVSVNKNDSDFSVSSLELYYEKIGSEWLIGNIKYKY